MNQHIVERLAKKEIELEQNFVVKFELTEDSRINNRVDLAKRMMVNKEQLAKLQN